MGFAAVATIETKIYIVPWGPPIPSASKGKLPPPLPPQKYHQTIRDGNSTSPHCLYCSKCSTLPKQYHVCLYTGCPKKKFIIEFFEVGSLVNEDHEWRSCCTLLPAPCSSSSSSKRLEPTTVNVIFSLCPGLPVKKLGQRIGGSAQITWLVIGAPHCPHVVDTTPWPNIIFGGSAQKYDWE